MKFKLHLSLIIALWILLITISFILNYTSAVREHEKVALQTAKSFFNLIVMTREWNAHHGGVYVPVTTETQPNPYLETPMRDIKINNNLTLTKINPAYMTRQISEIAQKENISFHITSLNPIRPLNKPNGIEEKALRDFQNGVKEKGLFRKNDAQEVFFYMAPLVTEKSCLSCHAKQGYREGDIRGGISVTFPMHGSIPLVSLLLGHLSIAIFGITGIIIGGRRLNKAYTTIKQQSTTDSLTGIANRRGFSVRILEELKLSQRENTLLSVIMCDIDDFKAYNDTYGHDIGDNCLKEVANTIHSTLRRPTDFCARYGGEEFVVILPNTGYDGATAVAENIRLHIEKLKIPHTKSSTTGFITISLGVTTSHNTSKVTHEHLVKRADIALYRAKEQGRNRVVYSDSDD